jgi:hypothetical protein
MPSPAPRRAFVLLTALLTAILVFVLALALLTWALTRPLPADAVAATRTAQPDPDDRPATPTPIPTLAAVSEELLVCQRQAALALNARQLVGAANLAADRELRLRWVSMDWAVEALDDALPGVVLGLDAALEVWKDGCAFYDRVEIEVYDRRKPADSGRAQKEQVLRLTVRAQVDDLLRWRAGEIGDRELLGRLEVGRLED